MNTKNIAFSLLIFSSFMSYCFQNEMSFQRQDMIRQSLYDGEIDSSFLDRETVATYIQILKDHKAALRYKIDNYCGYGDAIKGTICAWFSYQFAKVSLGLLLIRLVMVPNKSFSDTEILLSKGSGLLSGCSAAISLLLAKGAYGYLHNAWHAKENAMIDLAKDEELLALLEH